MVQPTLDGYARFPHPYALMVRLVTPNDGVGSVCVCGERKRPTFHPPRSRTICVQPGKYWHCFEANLGETAERRGGARMGLSEHYDAILS